jgi:hypothetical protein
VADGSTTWIAETREAVDRTSNLNQAQSKFETLVGIDEELDSLLPDLVRLKQTAALGRKIWWSGLDAPPDLWTQLRSAQIDLNQRQLASVVRMLTQFKTQLREVVQTKWKNHVASQAGDAGELRDLVQVLSGAEGLTEVARSLDEALGRLARLQRGLPDASALNALKEAIELLDALERLLPATVKAFVSAAARGGASLELLDSEVREWLVDNGVLHNFRVVPGRPQEVPRG